jgi:hypothetical protein
MSKQYTLKPIQAQMIQTINGQFQTMLSNFLSYIAIENWAYDVTTETQFKIIDGNKVEITENTVEPVTSTTANAMKGKTL